MFTKCDNCGNLTALPGIPCPVCYDLVTTYKEVQETNEVTGITATVLKSTTKSVLKKKAAK